MTEFQKGVLAGLEISNRARLYKAYKLICENPGCVIKILTDNNGSGSTAANMLENAGLIHTRHERVGMLAVRRCYAFKGPQ